MTNKDCGHYDDEKSQGLGRIIICIIFTLIILTLFTILLVWAILRPSKPHFILQDATLYTFNATTPNLLTLTVQVTLSSRNPNPRIGIYYDRLDIYASYQNQQITPPTRLPPTYQGHKDMSVWSPFLYGKSVPVAPYLGMSLQQGQNAGIVFVRIKADGRVRWKVGSWISGKYHIWVNCPAFITFGAKSKGVSVADNNNAVKYQLASSCHVDV